MRGEEGGRVVGEKAQRCERIDGGKEKKGKVRQTMVEDGSVVNMLTFIRCVDQMSRKTQMQLENISMEVYNCRWKQNLHTHTCTHTYPFQPTHSNKV